MPLRPWKKRRMPVSRKRSGSPELEVSSNEDEGELSPPGDTVVASEESEEDTPNAEEALGSFFVNGLRRSRRFPTNLLGSVQLGGVRRSARLLRR